MTPQSDGPGPRVLVAFASRHGATREIAATLVRELLRSDAGRRGSLSAVLSPVQRCPDPSDFDAVVLGSALYAGRWLEPARQYAETRASELRGRPCWLFSSGLVGGPPGAPRDGDDGRWIGDLVGARAHRIFPGRVEPRLLSSVERCTWAEGPAGAGDFRNWPAVRSWSDLIAGELVGRSALPLGA